MTFLIFWLNINLHIKINQKNEPMKKPQKVPKTTPVVVMSVLQQLDDRETDILKNNNLII